jgi:hypothetical protein
MPHNERLEVTAQLGIILDYSSFAPSNGADSLS